jgi:sulfatase modifying factor 1
MAGMGSPKGRRGAIAVGAVALVVLAAAVILGWRDILLLYRFERLGRNAQGLPEYRHRQTDIVFVLLPGGTFFMGAQKEDPSGPNYDPEAGDDEGPVHEVTLRPFLIAKHELTQAQWKSVMGSNPSFFKGDDDRPVESVSLDDIQEFEVKTGLSLPIQSQWEYACRGGAPGTGNVDEMGWNLMNQTGWYRMNSEGTTHPVRTKAANRFGLHDIYGNVSEWCEDRFRAGRAVRGGSWRDDLTGCRPTHFHMPLPSHKDEALGFCPACTAP